MLKNNSNQSCNLMIAASLLSVFFTLPRAAAQQPNRTPENYTPQTGQAIDQQERDSFARRQDALRKIETDARRTARRSSPSRPNQPSPENQAEANEYLNSYEKAKLMLLPPSVYYARFANELKNKKTHLARIFPDLQCDDGRVVAIEEIERCAAAIPIEGNGSFYSFRSQTNYGYPKNWWDIRFVNDKFAVGNDETQTLIADLGDFELRRVNDDSKAFKVLLAYQPVSSLTEIKARSKILEKGVAASGIMYSNAAAARLDNTYVVRTIAYSRENRSQYFGESNGLDALVAFRVVARESDGSLILLWKELRTGLTRKKLK